LGYELSKDEAEKVLNQIALDVLSDNLGKIKDKIENICHKLGRLSLLNSLKTKWKQLVSVETPREWSKKHLVPIKWVLEGEDYYQVFDLLDSVSVTDLELSRVEDAMSFLEEHKDKFKCLHAPDKFNMVFLKRLLPKSAYILNNNVEFVQDLKKFLVKRSGKHPHDWHHHETKIANLAEEYLRHYYANFKGRITEQLSKTSPEKIKKVLSGLLEDPDIGLKILSMLSKSNV
jgi:hypothetical protein